MMINSVRFYNNTYVNNNKSHKYKTSSLKFCAKGIFPETSMISSDVVRNITNFVSEPVDRILYLKKSFEKIVQNLCFDKDKSHEIFNKIIEAYHNQSRGYHDDKHIISMLKIFDDFISVNPDFVKKPNDFKFAIFMHDYVNGTQNEVIESAGIAEKFLKHISSDYNTDYIKKLILATDYSQKNQKLTKDEMLIQDLDLSILGSDKMQYNKYAKQIREQYSHIPDSIFNRERIKILQTFLDKESIYNINFFKSKYESQARKNISNEITTLK